MTNQVEAGGPSLFQARKTHHNHNHNHNHQHQHQHQHFHRRLHSHLEAPQPPAADSATSHIRLPSDQLHELHERQEVVVVQTVSVVHFVDDSGAVTSVSTIRSDSLAPSPLEVLPGVTTGLTALGDVLPSVSLSGLIPVPSDGAPSTTTSAQTELSSTLLSASSETLTSSPLSSSSAFPTLTTGIFNSSSAAFVPSLFSNSTAARLFSNTTRTSFTIFASTSTESSTAQLTTATASSDSFTIEGGSGVGEGAGAGAEESANAGAGSATASSAGADPTYAPGPGLTPEARNAVVGGVVGSVAGIALVVMALMFILKWRKQRSRGIRLLGDEGSAARGKGLGYGTSPPGGGGVMAERSTPFAVAAALAKLTGSQRSIAAAPAEPATQEKGFYRVSGRKLTSVLQSGGDGYSDPHDSIGSGTSYYRDSQAFFDSPDVAPLQLGSPMRPRSGIPVFRDGPQRTPVHEQVPVPPGHPPPALPATLPVPDALGRSFGSRDGSRVSRFTEDT